LFRFGAHVLCLRTVVEEQVGTEAVRILERQQSMAAPRLAKLRQQFDRSRLENPCGEVRRQLSRLDDLIRPGMRIAIAAGSRGIDNLASIVREISDYLKARGACAFVVPAMGSHGGATGEGQAAVLKEYGISEETIGAPVRSSMDTVELPHGQLPLRIFMDRHAFDSDGVILVNRVKPHTDYHGTYESGLMKMALIGLGKLDGARAVHHFGLHGLRELIAPGAAQVLASGKILAGVGLVENALHQTLQARVLTADEIPREEPFLLDTARRNMPCLPVEAIDVLVIDRMGKNISGVGIDPNVTGRFGVNGQPDAAAPRVSAIVVCDLTDESCGNAIGVGLADVITKRLYAKIDWGSTYANVITSSFLERGKMPIVVPSASEAFAVAMRSCGNMPHERPRVLRIRDTLHVEELYASPAAMEEISGDPEIVRREAELFDESGELTAF
jgi:hypothetical protein